jgi:hypothetical protein
MTDKTSEEPRRPRLNEEDEPDVEGHRFRHGPEEAGRMYLNEDADEDTDEAERRPR